MQGPGKDSQEEVAGGQVITHYPPPCHPCEGLHPLCKALTGNVAPGVHVASWTLETTHCSEKSTGLQIKIAVPWGTLPLTSLTTLGKALTSGGARPSLVKWLYGTSWPLRSLFALNINKAGQTKREELDPWSLTEIPTISTFSFLPLSVQAVPLLSPIKTG